MRNLLYVSAALALVGCLSQSKFEEKFADKYCEEYLACTTADVTGHRAEVDVLEVRLFGLEARARRRVAIHAHECAAREQLRGNQGMFLLDRGELLFRDHALPDSSTQLGDRAQRLGFEQDLALIDDRHARA